MLKKRLTRKVLLCISFKFIVQEIIFRDPIAVESTTSQEKKSIFDAIRTKSESILVRPPKDATSAPSTRRPATKKKSKSRLQLLKQKAEKTKKAHLKNGKFVDFSELKFSTRAQRSSSSHQAENEYETIDLESVHESVSPSKTSERSKEAGTT
jgi:hypothetical protein